MGDSKSPFFYKDSNNWEKMGQVSFISSLSFTPAFSGRGTQIIYSTLLPSGKAHHVSINERTDATIWKCKN